MAVDSAIRDLEAGRWEEGLEALIAEWGETRCPELAGQIQRLSDHATAARPPLEWKKPKERQTAWERRFGEGRLVDVGLLVAELHEGTAKAMKAKLKRLAELPPDPRNTPATNHFARTIRLSSTGARPCWTAFFRLVTHIGDPRSAPALSELRAWADESRAAYTNPEWAEFEAYLIKQVDKVLAKLPDAGATEGLEALRQAVERIVTRPFSESEDKAAVDVDALHAAVLESPDDIGAIAVWADALLESGDDRGTFVMLQIAAESRPLSGKEKTLLKRLQKANQASWLGSLGAAVDIDRSRFRRGLLEVATARPDRIDEAVATDPGWRSVEQLFSSAAHLNHPNLVSLKRVGTELVPDPEEVRGPVGFRFDPKGRALPWRDAVALAQAARPLEHLEVALSEMRLDEVALLQRGLKGLRTIVLAQRPYRQVDEGPLIPWLREVPEVVILNPFQRSAASEGWWLDRLPDSNVHFYRSNARLYRSWLRRDGQLHLVLSEASGVGLLTKWVRDHISAHPRRYDRPLGFLANAPAAASLTVRARSTWYADDLAGIRRRAGDRFGELTLPRARRT